ncbi:MAG: phytoene/squalene synthase family protein [Rubripirellula sp.]
MIESTSRICSTADPFDLVPVDDGEVIRNNSRSFAFASGLLPATVRDDVQKLYAWCRWCDDAVDSSASVNQANERLSILRNDVERIYRNEMPVHRASAWLAELAEKYDIDQELPLALLDGMGMDLELGQIGSENELLRYCYRAAGVVGLMMCRVFGVNDRRALRHAESLGIAMQLTNIARDVREDWQRGRCYLPQSWLPHGVDASSQDEIRGAVRRTLDLAEKYYEIGGEGMCYLPSAVRPAIRVAAAVYREIGTQIRRCDYRVLQGRVITPKFRFVSSAFTAWVRGVVRDIKHGFGFANNNQSESPDSFSVSTEFIMNDAKYLFYLGISLTAFMSSAAFLLVMLNPKDASYATLPIVYAAACFAVGIVTNVLAKRSETPVPVPVRVSKSERQ